MVTAAVLYGIMFFKIRKWSQLVGDSLNQPEQYIFYQTLFIIISKSLAVTLISLSCLIYGDCAGQKIFIILLFTDLTVTPAVIQGSYLLCNRSNIDVILSIKFKKLRTWKVIFCVAKPRRRRKKLNKVAIIEMKQNKNNDV